MDGYAVRFADGAGPWRLIGQSAAGAAFGGVIGPSETVRIFTGGFMPAGADGVLLQEDASAAGPAARPLDARRLLLPLPRSGK
jgi:molybdopterin molybdotransferase